MSWTTLSGFPNLSELRLQTFQPFRAAGGDTCNVLSTVPGESHYHYESGLLKATCQAEVADLGPESSNSQAPALHAVVGRGHLCLHPYLGERSVLPADVAGLSPRASSVFSCHGLLLGMAPPFLLAWLHLSPLQTSPGVGGGGGGLQRVGRRICQDLAHTLSQLFYFRRLNPTDNSKIMHIFHCSFVCDYNCWK